MSKGDKNKQVVSHLELVCDKQLPNEIHKHRKWLGRSAIVEERKIHSNVSTKVFIKGQRGKESEKKMEGEVKNADWPY